MKQVFPGTKSNSAKKRCLSSSSSDTEVSVVLDSDEASDEFDDLENMELLKDDDEINVNEFLLVKFPLKTNIIYYVGNVVDTINLNEFLIKFLRRKMPGYNFFYPNVDDISTIDRCDIMLKLPAPNTSKTARTSRLMSINANLSSYNVH